MIASNYIIEQNSFLQSSGTSHVKASVGCNFDSLCDSGGGGGSTTTLATTPAEKVKVTRETLAATLATCQAAMKQLDEKEDDSPAAPEVP